MEEIEIYSDTNEFNIDQICGLLDENKIVYTRKDMGAGSYMNVYMGSNANSISEKKIFVSTENYDKAKQLLNGFICNQENIEQETDDNSEEIKKYNHRKKIFSSIIVCIPLLMVIALILCLIIAYA